MIPCVSRRKRARTRTKRRPSSARSAFRSRPSHRRCSARPLNASEIRFATAAELTRALRRRRVSAVELARAALELLERLRPHYNALAAPMGERALAQAPRADPALARKGGGALTRGPAGAKDMLAPPPGP